ncbi:MAG: bifunctional nicotinamidase/pyrazinamidase [Chlamydiae bacterium]|nr:bifunctional nicotinamidase/pyrazinamidase [Chlamydiota bacterium]
MKALLIVDMENDFMPTGRLGVAGADEIIPIINHLSEQFSIVLACLDFHPKNHVSFASNHPGRKIGDVIEIGGIKQILWPEHCIENAYGSEIVKGLRKEKIAAYFYKGWDPEIDSYSAFFDNARKKDTGLQKYLRSKGITEIYLAGIATEYCVLYSALDAIELGFSAFVIEDACRAINLHPDDEKKALASMKEKGVIITNSLQVEQSL